jgi:hypothetical protein
MKYLTGQSVQTRPKRLWCHEKTQNPGMKWSSHRSTSVGVLPRRECHILRHPAGTAADRHGVARALTRPAARARDPSRQTLGGLLSAGDPGDPLADRRHPHHPLGRRQPDQPIDRIRRSARGHHGAGRPRARAALRAVGGEDGRLRPLGTSPVRPGREYDTTALREHGILPLPTAWTDDDLGIPGDLGDEGEADTITIADKKPKIGRAPTCSANSTRPTTRSAPSANAGTPCSRPPVTHALPMSPGPGLDDSRKCAKRFSEVISAMNGR